MDGAPVPLILWIIFLPESLLFGFRKLIRKKIKITHACLKVYLFCKIISKIKAVLPRCSLDGAVRTSGSVSHSKISCWHPVVAERTGWCPVCSSSPTPENHSLSITLKRNTICLLCYVSTPTLAAHLWSNAFPHCKPLPSGSCWTMSSEQPESCLSFTFSWLAESETSKS